MEIKKLNKELIQKANNNSFGGKRGDITEHDYEIYCQRVIGWNLSEKKTQKIVDKIYRYFSRSLALEAEHVSVAVAGASNYNAKKLDKSDKILSNSAEFCEWFKEIESEATQKPFDKIEWLKRKLYGLFKAPIQRLNSGKNLPQETEMNLTNCTKLLIKSNLLRKLQLHTRFTMI